VKSSPKTVLLLIALAFVHVAVLLAGFFAPYDRPADRDVLCSPRAFICGCHGPIHVAFRVYLRDPRDTPDDYVEDGAKTFPITFLLRRSQYSVLRLFNIPPAFVRSRRSCRNLSDGH